MSERQPGIETGPSLAKIGLEVGKYLAGPAGAAIFAPSNEAALAISAVWLGLMVVIDGYRAITGFAGSPSSSAPEAPAPKPERPVFKPTGRPIRERTGADRAGWTPAKKEEIRRGIK